MRKLCKPMKGVRDVIPVTKETHRFNGCIGFCDGHSRHANGQIVVPNAIVPDTASLLLKCLNDLVQLGSQFSAGEILQHWKEQQVEQQGTRVHGGSGVPNEVMVTDESGSSNSSTKSPTTLPTTKSAASIGSVSCCHS
jgi:hypothetical protein